MPSEAELGYAAGIIDGEGCITVSKRETASGRVRYYCAVAVSMVDECVPRWLLSKFGGFSYEIKRKNPNWRTLHCWRVENRSAATFLSAIVPYLRLKKRRAELGIQLCSLVRVKGRYKRGPMTVEEESERREIAEQVHAENQRVQ